MGKFQRGAGGGGGGSGRGGGDGGGGVARQGGEMKGKRRAYDGLKVLERGVAGQKFQTTKQAQRWADKKHADKKRAALERLYGEMSEHEKQPISGVFDAGEHARAPARPGHPAGAALDGLEESGSSSSDCSLSDEEVDDGQIVFKDEALQRKWGPVSHAKSAQKEPAVSGGASSASAQRPGGAKASKAERLAAAQGPAAVGSFMEVPDWDAEESGAAFGGAWGKMGKAAKSKAKLPDKITFGDKQRPEVLAVLSKKADDKKKQMEREKAEAQQARYVG